MNDYTTFATIAILAAFGLLAAVVIDSIPIQPVYATVGKCPTPAKEFPDNHINHGWSATQKHCS
jgi:hypothetical protein